MKILFVLILTILDVNWYVWGAPPPVTTVSPLAAGFEDIRKLLPIDKFKEIAANHAINDTGFRAAVQYFQGKEWVDLVEKVKVIPEWIAFKKFMAEIGINIDDLVKCLETYLKETKINGTVPADAKKDLKAYLIDIEKILPTTKILVVLGNMMKDPKFQELHTKLSSSESRTIIEKVRALPEIKKMTTILDDMGVGITQTFSLVYIYLGWN